jgi:hypothetical protein
MSKSRQLKKRGDVVGLQLTVKKKRFNKSGEKLVNWLHLGCSQKKGERMVFKDMECRQ